MYGGITDRHTDRQTRKELFLCNTRTPAHIHTRAHARTLIRLHERTQYTTTTNSTNNGNTNTTQTTTTQTTATPKTTQIQNQQQQQSTWVNPHTTSVVFWGDPNYFFSLLR